jgi:hypothetical protein
MPYVDYNEWYRREQQKRGQNPQLPNVGVRPTVQQPNLKPSAVQEILASPVGQEGIKQAGSAIYSYFNPATAATQAAAQGAAQAGTQAAAQTAAQQAALASGVYPGSLVGQAFTQAGTQAAAQGAAQAGTQAAAQGAAQGAAQAGTQGAAQAGASTASSAASAAGTALGVLGAAKGGYDLYRGIAGKQGARSTTMSGMSTGMAIGGLVGGPAGAAIGAAIGAAVGAGAGALRPPPKTQVEDKRWRALARRGFDVPQWVKQGIDIKDSGFRQDLAPDFVGYDEQGAWVNNKFAKSRKESDLTEQDISQYAVMPETFGSLWVDSDDQSKFQVANLARENNLLREHHGTLDINWTPRLLRQAQDILSGAIAENPEQAKRKRWVPLGKDEGWQPLR